MERVKFFSEIGAEDRELAGGKGANLGELYSIGLRVPDGFVVTSEAFEEVMGPDIKSRIKEKLEGADLENRDELKVVSEELKSILLSKNLDSVRDEIIDAYKEMGEPLVAVRSSATSEDAEKASFAGQFTTFLNVGGVEDLLEAVRECWASLFNPRVIMYREAHELSHSEARMAVVVQEMIDSEKSGVVFSKSHFGNEDEMVIEATFGLGESLVSGSITPDEYRVSRDRGEITKVKVNRQLTYHFREGDETVEERLPEEKREARKLTDDEILKIADLAMKIEKHYGCPQDVEWGICEGRIYILQSRPITGIQ